METCSTVDRKDSASQSLTIAWYCILEVNLRWASGPDSKDLEYQSKLVGFPWPLSAVRYAGILTLTCYFLICKSKERALLGAL